MSPEERGSERGERRGASGERAEREGRREREGPGRRPDRAGRPDRPDRRDDRRDDRRGPRRDHQYDYIPAEYPREVPQPPARPDYDEMRHAQEEISAAISAKSAAIAQLRAQARALAGRKGGTGGDRGAFIDPQLRQEAAELNTDFRERLAAQAEVRRQLDLVDARSRSLRDQFGPLAGLTEEQFRQYLRDRTYEYEHTSTSVKEERAAKAEIARLEAMLPLVPEMERLMTQRTELRERLAAARAHVDELRGRKNEIDSKMSAARASATEVLSEREAVNQELAKLDAQRDALQAEIDALKKKRDALEAAFTEKLSAVLRLERAQERALLDRRILRRRWEDALRALRAKGVSAEEEGEDTGVFVLRNHTVTSLAAVPGNEGEYAKGQLIAWCRAALESDQFGTVAAGAGPDRKRKGGARGKSVGELDFQVLDLLDKLHLPASRVEDRASVEALVAELEHGDKAREESALRAANEAIQKDISALRNLHAQVVLA